MKKSLVLFLLILVASTTFSQVDSLEQDYPPYNPKRVRALAIGSSVAYLSSMYGLNAAWYAQYPRGPFHFESDNHRWLQVDKVGHLFSAYGESILFIDACKWAGIPQKKAALIGGGFGFFAQTVIEILDGFSVEWGASSGDLIANTLGSGLGVGQELAWQQQRIRLKWSFHPVNYPASMEERAHKLYGDKVYTSFIKDYNGQTYWISVNPNDFNQLTFLPKWMNIAVGYGGEQIYGGDGNYWTDENDVFHNYTHIPRIRQYYFSLDVDLRHLKGKNKAINTLIALLNVLKFPMPTLEFSKQGMRFHPIYF